MLALTHPLAVASEPAWGKMRDGFAAKDQMLTREMEQGAASLDAYSRRGDVRLFLGRFAEARADYQKMIEIDPAQDTPHWRLGIALYFCGEFAAAAQQFAKYHAYDNRDRENGIWKFLSQARSEGIPAAQAGMLVYERFDREPFPSLYAMFAGQKSEEEVLAEVKRKGLENQRLVQFFAHYYCGLHADLRGDATTALRYLAHAVEVGAQGDPQDSPGYMWHVARLQWEIAKTRAAEPAGSATGVDPNSHRSDQ